MSPISKRFGFYLLLGTGVIGAIIGDPDSHIFIIAALFYEAIKNDPNP